MNTTAETNAHELRDRLSRFEKQLAAAQRDIGAASLDGESITAGTNRAREAREGIEAAKAALEELQRRDAEAAEEARTGEASERRLATYEWMVEYLEVLAGFLERRAEFQAAEQSLKNFRRDTKFLAAKRGGRNNSPDESDLDTDLVLAVPDAWDPERAQKTKGAPWIHAEFSPERARQLRQFAEARAEEERSGNGVDRSREYGTWDREQNEKRKTRRAAQVEGAA